MAGTPQAVHDFLMQVWHPAKAQAEADARVLEKMLHADGINGALEPWDWRYYSEKRRRAEHDLDEAVLKPYLSLEAMIAAAFDCAERLFGLQFHALDVPLYHPDARAWEVTRQGGIWRCLLAIISPAHQNALGLGVPRCAVKAPLQAIQCARLW